MNNFFKTYRPYLIIIAVGLVGYWQVAFMQNILKWDMVDQYFPWRYFVSESLRNGIFPQWNPYQHSGYPIHADPQSGVWYPIVWIISFVYGYDIYANQFDFVLHIILGGIGMFLLTRYFINNTEIAVLTGCCYMLSGFFVGNAQHLTYIVSGAWVPFILFYYLRMIQQNEWKDIVRVSLCFFMLLTGGYPAFTIILSYSLLVIFFLQLFHLVRDKNRGMVKKLVLNNFLFLFLTLVLTSGMLISLFTGLQYFTRSQKLSLEIINQMPFAPQSLISCLLSLVTATDRVFIDSDISMSNLNFGTICFAAFLFSFFRKKDRKEKIILAGGIFFMLASFGAYTPVRKFLYDFVPLMDVFRFPSIFRLFTIICFMILAAFSLRDLFEKKISIKTFRIVLISILIFYVLTTVIAFTKDPLLNLEYFNASFNSFVNGLNFWESAVIQSVLLFIVLLIFLIVLRNDFNKKFKYLFWIVIADIFISAQLNIPVTATSDIATSKMNDRLAAMPQKFPIPKNQPAIMYSDSSGSFTPFWRNLGIFYKRPQFDGYNPFHLKGFEQLSNEPVTYNQVLSNNIAFFSDSYSFYSDTIRDAALLKLKPTHIFFRKDKKTKINFNKLETTPADQADFISFRPDKIKIQSHTSGATLFTLMQHNYPGWKVTVDGSKTPHFTSDYMFTTIFLPPGNHLIEYSFENRFILAGLIFTITSLLVCCALLFAKRKNSESFGT